MLADRNDVKFAWKVQRDVEERGWTEEQVREDIEKRLPDFSKYVDPQKERALSAKRRRGTRSVTVGRTRGGG
eukprot:Skav235444  [mRNA]  locus=scaffold2206:74111:75479:- [translate_table: standard]